MKNNDLIFDKNEKCKYKMNKIYRRSKSMSWFEFRCKQKEINSDTILDIITFIKYIIKTYNAKSIPIYLNMKNKRYSDKLTWVILELIVSYTYSNFAIKIYCTTSDTQYIHTTGCLDSAVAKLDDFKCNFQEFSDKVDKNIQLKHYRRIIKVTDSHEDICKFVGDIGNTIRNNKVNQKMTDDITDAIAELIGNATEHGESDCLVDIDINENKDNIYSGILSGNISINVAILNFSEELLGNKIKQKLTNKKELDDRHTLVKLAYNKHKKQFGSNYNESDFYTMASFQDKITSRDKDVDYNESTGGTGLAKIIKIMNMKEEFNYCYMLTGNRVIHFSYSTCHYDDKGWIGFNAENDFLNKIPDQKHLDCSKVFFPGIAYNLVFIVEKNEV